MPEQLDNSKSSLYNLKNEKFINVLKGNPDNLNIINWKSKNLPKTKNYLLGNSRYFFHSYQPEDVRTHVENTVLIQQLKEEKLFLNQMRQCQTNFLKFLKNFQNHI